MFAIPALTDACARLAAAAVPSLRRACAALQRAADACESLSRGSVPMVTLRWFNGAPATIPAHAEVRADRDGAIYGWQTWPPGIKPILSAAEVAANVKAGRPTNPWGVPAKVTAT